jgi:WhiB family transcriptional regulator, redox-sensing transcriptional regulator
VASASRPAAGGRRRIVTPPTGLDHDGSEPAMAEMKVSPSGRGSSHPPAADPDPAPASSRWQRWAACRAVPTRVFFPAGNFARMEEKQAKSVCALCTVRGCCLAFAIEHDEGFGIWGGLSVDERRALAARQAGERAS